MKHSAISSAPERRPRRTNCGTAPSVEISAPPRLPPADRVRPWTTRYLIWVGQDVHFTHAAQETTLMDYLHEVDHMSERVLRLERAIHEAVQAAPPTMRAVIAALQALRGVAEISAVSIVAEVGPLSRFATARQLMGYSGAVPREDSSEPRTRRGAITKTGNAHLRHIIVEAAWAYRSRPALGATIRKREAMARAAARRRGKPAHPLRLRQGYGGPRKLREGGRRFPSLRVRPAPKRFLRRQARDTRTIPNRGPLFGRRQLRPLGVSSDH